MSFAEQFEFRGRLGSGGMGVVGKYWDRKLHREVAVKTLKSDPRRPPSDEQKARHKLEAVALAQLSHPNIVQVHELIEEGNETYIVMELVDGNSLAEELVSGPIQSSALIRSVIPGVAAALDYMHSRSVIHRDIKPGNILLDSKGKVKVTDFGIARQASLAGLTQSGMVAGTPGYWSPEQMQASGNIGPASDQYSLAVVAFEMLTGRRPEIGSEGLCVGAAAVNGFLIEDIDHVLARALDPNPEKRYEHCADFARQLMDKLPTRTVISGSSSDSTTGFDRYAQPRPLKSRKSRSRAFAWAVVALMCGAAGWFGGRRYLSPSPQDPRAHDSPPGQKPAPVVSFRNRKLSLCNQSQTRVKVLSVTAQYVDTAGLPKTFNSTVYRWNAWTLDPGQTMPLNLTQNGREVWDGSATSYTVMVNYGPPIGDILYADSWSDKGDLCVPLDPKLHGK